MFETIFQVGKFFLGALLCNGIGVASSFFSGIFSNNYFGMMNSDLVGGDYQPPNQWYANLNKPAIWPPNFLFGPVWFSLYTVMGIGFTMICMNFGITSIPSALFLAQITLNFAWSIFFFNFNQIFNSLVIIGLINVIYIAMLASIYFGFFEGQGIDTEILKTASRVASGFMLLIPFLMTSLIKNVVSSLSFFPFSSLDDNTKNNILPYVISGLFSVLIFVLLFVIVQLPNKFSGFETNTAITIMLSPTILWTLFATYLNYTIYTLNS